MTTSATTVKELPVIEEQAAEIERLKDELRDHRTDAPDDTKWSHLVQRKHEAVATIAKQTAEIKRLERDIEVLKVTANAMPKAAARVVAAVSAPIRRVEALRDRWRARMDLPRSVIDELSAAIKGNDEREIH